MSPSTADYRPADPGSCHSSRRDFLSHTAAVAGAAAILGPRAIAGQDAAAAAMRPIRMGLIGTGGMGGGHLSAFMGFNRSGAERVHIVALSDVCKPRLDGALEKCRSRQAEEGVEVEGYADYQDLIARDDLDCVLIAAPEHWHAQMAIDAIAAGKDVYCEKPMTRHLEDAIRLQKVVRASDRRLQVGTQYMMLPRYRAAKKLIAEGAIGHPTLSQTSYCRNTPAGEWNYYGIDPQVEPGPLLDWERWCGPEGMIDFDTKIYHRWRRYRQWSTGIIGDLLVHQITPLIYALDRGAPIRVSTAGGHYVDHDMENHDQVFLTVEFEKNHTMVVAGSTINSTGVEPLIRGNQANILLGSNNCVLQPEKAYVDDIDPLTVQCDGIRDQDELRLNWLHCVRTREEVQSTVELGLHHMIIVELASRSLWEGGTWEFDPERLTYGRA